MIQKASVTSGTLLKLDSGDCCGMRGLLCSWRELPDATNGALFRRRVQQLLRVARSRCRAVAVGSALRSAAFCRRSFARFVDVALFRTCRIRPEFVGHTSA